MINKNVHKIEIQQKLCLALDVLRYTKGMYVNTSDLVKFAEKYNSSEVRLRKDKTDYIYYDDTKVGGLRGNFSNILTAQGFFKKGNRIETYYGLGYKNKILNAVHSGKIILQRVDKKYFALTKDKNLANLIELESKLYLIREQQSHIKDYIKKNTEREMERDKERFPKESVVKTQNNILFLRAKINNFKDKEVLEYKLIPYWKGKKLKIYNIHLMVVFPNNEDGWGEFFAVQFEQLFKNKPISLFINIKNKECVDESGNEYKLIPFKKAKLEFSREDENTKQRLDYDWKILQRTFWEKEKINQENTHFQKDEYSLFVDKFLKWKKEFKIGIREVVDISVSSSGGADVRLKFAGGTDQKLELEHKWKNYLEHGHHRNNSWENTWLWSEEILSYKNIKNIFLNESKTENKSRIPTHFLGTNKQDKRKLLIINWDDVSYRETDIL